MARIDAIREIIRQSPDDPFPRYGLAMELKNSGSLEEARAEFQALAERFPDYVPQYLMHGGILTALELYEEARAVYQRGIEAATRRGDAHAQSELAQAMAALPEA